MGETGDVNGCRELEWLDSAYLNKILMAYEGKCVKVITFDVKPATSKGENYASAMHLVTAEYTVDCSCREGRTLSMIVKSRLKSELMDEIEGEFNVFEREAQMYSCIMTSCENILQSAGEGTIFGPRAIYVDDRVIVQENLKEKGYGILDVRKGLNYEECRMVMEKLAKFHACTMVLHRKNPELFVHHQKGNVSEKHTPLHDLYTNLIETCVEYIKTVPDLKRYAPKLDVYRKDIIQKMIGVFSRNATGVNVLNHGDVWVNNLMFKKDADGRPLALLLVDYQEGFFGSPGIDLNYFMYSSWQKDVYLNKKDDLIEEYSNVLINTLKRLKYDQTPPTLEDIHREIRLKGNHGITTATCLLPILISEHQELADPSTFLDDSEEAKRNRFTVLNNEKFANLLRVYLPDFESQGIL